MKIFKHSFIVFIVIILLFCLIQNNAFALDQIDYDRISSFLDPIRDKALNGKEDEAIEELTSIINTKPERFQKNEIDKEKILFLKLDGPVKSQRVKRWPQLV